MQCLPTKNHAPGIIIKTFQPTGHPLQSLCVCLRTIHVCTRTPRNNYPMLIYMHHTQLNVANERLWFIETRKLRIIIEDEFLSLECHLYQKMCGMFTCTLKMKWTKVWEESIGVFFGELWVCRQILLSVHIPFVEELFWTLVWNDTIAILSCNALHCNFSSNFRYCKH